MSSVYQPPKGKYRVIRPVTWRYCSQYGPSSTGIVGPWCRENRNVVLQTGDVVDVKNWAFDDHVNKFVAVISKDIPLINGMMNPAAQIEMSILEKVADSTPIHVTNWSAPDNPTTVITHGQPSYLSGILPDSKQGRFILIGIIVAVAAYLIFKPK